MEKPRRYGKSKILSDIENQDGLASSLQNLMLSINDLKNTYVNLSNITISDYFNEKKILSNSDCDIIKKIIDESVENLSCYNINNLKPKKNSQEKK